MTRREFFWTTLFVITAFSIVFYIDSVTNDEIDKNLGKTTGTILKASQIKLQHWFTYSFIVEGKLYVTEEGKSETKYVKGCCRDNSCIGKQFVVEYSTINPQKSRILLDQPLPDTFHIVKPPANK